MPTEGQLECCGAPASALIVVSGMPSCRNCGTAFGQQRPRRACQFHELAVGEYAWVDHLNIKHFDPGGGHTLAGRDRRSLAVVEDSLKDQAGQTWVESLAIAYPNPGILEQPLFGDEPDSVSIRTSALICMEHAAGVINRCASAQIQIVGSGESPTIAIARASAVVDYLVGAGVERVRLSIDNHPGLAPARFVVDGGVGIRLLQGSLERVLVRRTGKGGAVLTSIEQVVLLQAPIKPTNQGSLMPCTLEPGEPSS